MAPPRYRIFISRAVEEQLEEVFSKARARGQEPEAVAAAAKIEEGLIWLADELGESRFTLNVLGELRVVVIGPVEAVFAVNRERLEVHVGSFRLLGLHRGG